ncbi:sulfotransferase domain-containing protein [Nocardioides cynanchi]|uniref:sulfotransferase domain-containing protein n=1 Tax=Nocardioides cynanchi TaxID=2558918 RepID=UPI001246C2A3|nr:sulfotransferase domain-containing protein [Nocardioides cynanchi]
MCGDGPFTRPSEVEDLIGRLDAMLTPGGRRTLDEFVPEPGDVFITTPPKCGTTWMQQIVHGLRSGGSMDFANINEVVPWLGMSHVDPDAARAAQHPRRPHVFKSHAGLDGVPPGARYIVVLRDPADALVSHYRFFAGSFLDADRLDFETFARDFFLPRCEVHQHVAAAWPRRDDPDVRIFCYESMVADLPGTVAAVAAFLSIPLTDELREVVVAQARLGFMKQHESKFDDALLFESVRHRMRLPPASSLSKVAPDGVGAQRQAVSVELHRELDTAWRTRVTPRTGLTSYADLRAALDASPPAR